MQFSHFQGPDTELSQTSFHMLPPLFLAENLLGKGILSEFHGKFRPRTSMGCPDCFSPSSSHDMFSLLLYYWTFDVPRLWCCHVGHFSFPLAVCFCAPWVVALMFASCIKAVAVPKSDKPIWSQKSAQPVEKKWFCKPCWHIKDHQRIILPMHATHALIKRSNVLWLHENGAACSMKLSNNYSHCLSQWSCWLECCCRPSPGF